MSNTFFKESLTKKPGEFRARCSLTRPHRIKDMAEYQRREAAEAGWQKGTLGVEDRGVQMPCEVYLEPLCEGFETADRAAFEDHMKTVHGKRVLHGENSGLVKRASGKWRTPRAPATPQPLVKAAAEQIQTCAYCGLVAEVQPTKAWHLVVGRAPEHVRRASGRCGVSVIVTQTCDRCGESRELRAGYYGQARNFGTAAQQGGWREVRGGKHLCSACIRGVLEDDS